MKCHLRQAFIMSMLIAVAAGLTVSPIARAETYTSTNFKYPDTFDNNAFGTNNNDLQYLDAVYFAGRELVIFSLFSSDDLSYNSKIYFHDHETGYHQAFDIGNSQDLDFHFKACVLNNVLYLFYTPTNSVSGYSTSTIYYRTFTVDTSGGGWVPAMSGLKSFPAGYGSVKLRAVAMMNGNMLIVFTSGSSWYSISSPDGLHFGSSALLLTSDSIRGAGGAVFQVPDDAEGERMMLAFCTTGSRLKYFFFNGTSAYGLQTVDTSGLDPRSVRLAAGSATGYTNSKYSVQVWLATPIDQVWSYIYHREYIPKGAQGEQGTWSSSWNQLSKSSEDHIKFTGNAYDSDPSWAVIPYFTNEDLNVRMTLRIFYHRGSSADECCWRDHVLFRRSTYTSDLLVYDGSRSSEVQPGSQDLSTSTVLGVIEGAPPFPLNSDPSTWLRTDNISTVEFEATQDIETTTAWSVGGTVTVLMGKTFGKVGVKAQASAGLKYTKETGSADSCTINLSGVSFMRETPGDTGWLLVLKPHIINSAYILHAYDGTLLHYDGYVGETDNDVLRLSIIAYGNLSALALYQYNLEDPTSEWSYGPVLQGMKSRPLSTKIKPAYDGDSDNWQNTLSSTDPSYTVEYALPNIPGAPTTEAKLTVVKATTEAETWSPSAGFKTSAKALGFGVETDVEFEMDITTKTTMTTSLGFYYMLTDCDGYETCCLERVDVTPYILLPKDDATGYDAPWISDDIRNYSKPKPWCLSYRATPGDCKPAGVSSTMLEVADARALFLHRPAVANRDQALASITLKGLARDFSLKALEYDQAIHLRFGNYTADPRTAYIVSRRFEGRNLVIELKETEESDSSLVLRLSHDAKRARLKIDLDARRIDLTHLFHAYGLDTVRPSSRNLKGMVPFGFFLGGRYYAEGEFEARCTFIGRNIVCRVRGMR